MSIKIIKLDDTITALQFDVMNCIRNEENISKVIDKSETLLKEIEINTEVATSTDQPKENNNPTVIDFFDYKPPKDWYMTLFNTILDYCSSNKITDTDTLEQGIKDLLTSFLKYDDVIRYLKTAKNFIVINSKHIILDTQNGNEWNTSSFEKNYKDTDVYLISIIGRIKSMTFSEIFSNSKICRLFKKYNKSGFKPYNPLKEKAALDNDTYNYYKPVFTVKPQLDKDLEKKFRHGAKFLLKVLWDHTERNTIKFKWLQGCIAHKVQYPAVTVQQCLAINGKKKCGKNTIYRTLAKDIFKDYGLIKQNLNGLTGRFNTDLCNKVVVVYDETKNVKTLDRLLKGIVGNPVLGVEFKGEDTTKGNKGEIDNFALIIFLSNDNDNSISVGERHLVGFVPQHRHPQKAFTKFYENYLNDPSIKEKLIHWLWYQLTMLDFKKFGYDPYVYPEFAKREAMRKIEEEPLNLEQCVLASFKQWHRDLSDNLERLERNEKIISDIFDKATLINIKSSIGTKQRYKSTDGTFSTPLYSLVLYCARDAFEHGFTKIQIKKEMCSGSISSIYCTNWSIIEEIKKILGKIYTEYDIYKKKQNDNRYLIPHPTKVLEALETNN